MVLKNKIGALSCAFFILFSGSSFAQDHHCQTNGSVLFIGDSLCEGLSRHTKKTIEQSGYKFQSHCISGSTTSQWIKFIKYDIDKFNPNIILISLGTNDSGNHYESIKRNEKIYKDFVDILVENRVKWIWVGPPKLDEKKLSHSKDVRSKIEQAAEKSYIDSTKFSFQQSEDGIHATVSGYKTWSLLIFDHLVREKIINP